MDAANKTIIKSEPCKDLHHKMPYLTLLVLREALKIISHYYLNNTYIISRKIMPFILLNYFTVLLKLTAKNKR